VFRSVGAQTVTVVRGEAREDIPYDLSDPLGVLVDGKEAKTSDLADGMHVRLVFTEDFKRVVQIRAEGPSVSGEVASVDAEKGGVVLAGRRGEDGRQPDAVYPLAPDATVTIDGKDGALADLKPGSRIDLRLSADRKRVLAISQGRRKGGEEKAGRKGPPTLRADLTRIETELKVVSFAYGEDRRERELPLAAAARILIEGAEGKLDDLRPRLPARARVTLSDDEKEIVEISVGSPKAGGDR
jgi:hypothetical protein